MYSAECYPVAKAGGLGDVVGALPKYLNNLGHIAKVVMPMYRTKYLYNQKWEVVHKGGTNMANWWFDYTIIKEATNDLGFDLYLVDINGLLDREKIYGYEDDSERFHCLPDSCAGLGKSMETSSRRNSCARSPYRPHSFHAQALFAFPGYKRYSYCSYHSQCAIPGLDGMGKKPPHSGMGYLEMGDARLAK